MLNFALKGTYQDASGYSWDYYGDDQLDPNPNPNTIYIIPQPQFVLQPGTKKPVFSIVKNETDDASNGSGTCHFEVELGVPQNVQSAISTAVLANKAQFPHVTSPNFVSLQWNAGGTAGFTLTTDGVPTYISAPVAGFGGNVASFLVNLNPHQMKSLVAAFTNPAGASSIEITYNLSVPARLQGVKAVLTFDSAVAYQYQVTQPTYNSWGDEVSPGSVQSLLKQSESSTVTLTWGVSNPPAYLVTQVTSWANQTIADLVTAEVKKVIELQGMQSASSFNISEVSNFTANFNENMVIDWKINPQNTLPSLQGLGLNVNDVSSTVNERQQTMMVTVNLPFVGTPEPYIPTESGGSSQPTVKNVVVTAIYPGLPEATSTYTFTSNNSTTFSTGYDTAQGPNWSLKYTINFQDTTLKPLTATISNIATGNYNLTMADAGILTVNFDATNAFTLGANIPNSVEINMSFVNTNDAGVGSAPFNYKLTLDANHLKGNITSLQALPINSGYNYQVTYYYKTAPVPYPAPTMQNQTGFKQTIVQAAGEHQVNTLLLWLAADAAGDQLLDGSISLWYDTPPNLPSWYPVASLPTKANPTTFNITPNTDPKGNSIGKAVFYGLTTCNQPLYYTATLTPEIANQIVIESQMIQNTINTIKASPSQRYLTLQVDPAAIDWKNNPFSQIQVQATFHIAQGTSPTPVPPNQSTVVMDLTWNGGEMDNQYLTIPIMLGNTVTYDTKVTYITTGKPIQSTQKTGLSDLTFNIPATPTS